MSKVQKSQGFKLISGEIRAISVHTIMNVGTIHHQMA